MKPKIYISGPVTNNPNYMEDFRKCQDYLIKEGIYDPINPTKLTPPMQNPTWIDYMKTDICFLMFSDCNDIIMLPEFWKSKGAKIELRLAIDLDYQIHHFIYDRRVSTR